MIATKTCFDSRKDEIEFYFRVLRDIARHNTPIAAEDNNRFVRMLKSNFLLMLYNLIESCIKSGFEEIYEIIKAEGVSYVQASNALRDIWSNYEISKAYKDTANRETYSNQVKNILEQVISDAPVLLPRKAVEAMARGNLDALKIRELLKKHDINFTETNIGDKLHILTVKKKRNSLAHGDESFDEAARDLTFEDLEKTKDEVLVFIEDVINGIEDYYINKLYRVK